MQKERRTRSVAALLLAGLFVAAGVLGSPGGPRKALAGGDWNDAQIGWLSYQKGLEAAAKSGKPICLVFYTDWCPHCRNYSGVFHDPRVVEAAKKFVMIRVERDSNRELSSKYAPDGDYIPRTLFLSPQGELWEDIHAQRAQYVYFYDERRAESLLAGMRAALGRAGSK
ncbi:MAG: hypothetical protein D6815_00340 [Candidatus Dadabacteria bacterium]|nr:MAG: hypothetical protein D6815_00340 [Candidatus Dadabacteria bacterium]